MFIRSLCGGGRASVRDEVVAKVRSILLPVPEVFKGLKRSKISSNRCDGLLYTGVIEKVVQGIFVELTWFGH